MQDTGDVGPAGGDEPAPTASPDRFRTLPPRVALEDMVEEMSAEDPPPDLTPDPNTAVAWRWGVGIAPGG